MHPACTAIAAKYGLRRSGSRHVGQCPECGGSTSTNRFVLFDDGGYKCFSCGIGGDRIKWLRSIEGLTCRQAHDQEGASCSPTCPVYASCRDGQPAPKRHRQPLSVPESGQQRTVKVEPSNAPNPLWVEWGWALVERSHATLAKMPEQIAWLEARGVTRAQIDAMQLGWIGHDFRERFAAIGLPNDGDKIELWIPSGMLIPMFDPRDGRLLQLRVRRDDVARGKFLPDLKYYELKGSAREAMVLGAGSRGLVMVEAELDAAAIAAAHPGVRVLSLHAAGRGISPWQHRMVQQAPVVLVALDADGMRPDGTPGAGQVAAKAWLASYRQARYYPVPAGKDPGDYVKDHGGDLRAWVEAGLPPVIEATDTAPTSAAQQPPTAPQDKPFSPE